MKIRIFYYCALVALTWISMFMFIRARKEAAAGHYRFNRSVYKGFKERIRDRAENSEYNRIFSMAGLNVNILQYQIVRNLVFIAALAAMVFKNRYSLQDMINLQLVLLLALYYLSAAQASMFGRKSPFMLVIGLLTHEYNNKKNIEIKRALSQLKNMASIRQDNPPGAVFIFEQLRKFTKTTRPIFNRMIALYQSGRPEEAQEYFISAVGTPEGVKLANILFKLDSINPVELRNQLQLYQESIDEANETASLKRGERRGMYIFIVALGSAMIVLVNFIVVVLYLDSVNLLKYNY